MAINTDTGDTRTYTFGHPLVDPSLIGFTAEWPDAIPPASPSSEKYIVSYGVIDQFDLYDYIVRTTFREAVLLLPGLHIRRHIGMIPSGESPGIKTYVIQRDSDAQNRSRSYELI